MYVPGEQTTLKVMRRPLKWIDSNFWTSIRDGAMATAAFFRASLCEGSPPIFFAENGGGTWSRQPVSDDIAASISSRAPQNGISSPVGTPSRSYVFVAKPNRISPSYSFGALGMNC